MVTYSSFRTGLTFAEVRKIVEEESLIRYETEGQYIRITRSRILGKWREIKLTLWEYYKESQDDGL